jgi:oligoribonuclease NrnB/cAMP/cGMP phosphodiesterase (DHH superfamily)
MTEYRPLCIWHANCLDGFTSAWAVNKYFKGEVDFVAANYGEVPPDVIGRDVLIVDFSYKRPVLLEMASKANAITVLDHHETARIDLEDLNPLPAEWDADDGVFADKGIVTVFDMDRAGAGITWDFLFPKKGRPMLVNYVEDRDLWRFKLIRTREIIASLQSYEMTFDTWEDFAKMIDDKDAIMSVAAEGHALLRKQNKEIAGMIERSRRMMRIGGYTVPVANLSIHISEAAHVLCENQPFAGAYYDGKDVRHFSLRSRTGGVDVANIAASYGGGGHVHASGFKMPIGWEGDPQ